MFRYFFNGWYARVNSPGPGSEQGPTCRGAVGLGEAAGSHMAGSELRLFGARNRGETEAPSRFLYESDKGSPLPVPRDPKEQQHCRTTTSKQTNPPTSKNKILGKQKFLESI